MTKRKIRKKVGKSLINRHNPYLPAFGPQQIPVHLKDGLTTILNTCVNEFDIIINNGDNNIVEQCMANFRDLLSKFAGENNEIIEGKYDFSFFQNWIIDASKQSTVDLYDFMIPLLEEISREIYENRRKNDVLYNTKRKYIYATRNRRIFNLLNNDNFLFDCAGKLNISD
jgi:hypothetical protein